MGFWGPSSGHQACVTFIYPSFAENLFIFISIGVTVAIAVVFTTSHLMFVELLVSHRTL